MADASDERRDALHRFLQEQGPPPGEHEGSLLTGWVVVASWMDPDGDTFLAKMHAAELSHWMANGMHHEALYGDWPTGDDDG